MRATTQPCARSLGEEAEKPSSTDAPMTKTLTPFETRIIILVWLRPLFAVFALRITKDEQLENFPGANSWFSGAIWQPELLDSTRWRNGAAAELVVS